MKFTKTLYRDIEIDGQQLTVAMGPRGVYVRAKGKRRWRAVHWRALLDVMADYEGQPEETDPPIAEPLAAIEDGKGCYPEPVEEASDEPEDASSKEEPPDADDELDSTGSKDRTRKILEHENRLRQRHTRTP